MKLAAGEEDRMIWRIPLLLLSLCYAATCAGQAVTVGHEQRIHSAVLSEDRTYQVSLPLFVR